MTRDSVTLLLGQRALAEPGGLSLILQGGNHTSTIPFLRLSKTLRVVYCPSLAAGRHHRPDSETGDVSAT